MKCIPRLIVSRDAAIWGSKRSSGVSTVRVVAALIFRCGGFVKGPFVLRRVQKKWGPTIEWRHRENSRLGWLARNRKAKPMDLLFPYFQWLHAEVVWSHLRSLKLQGFAGVLNWLGHCVDFQDILLSFFRLLSGGLCVVLRVVSCSVCCIWMHMGVSINGGTHGYPKIDGFFVRESPLEMADDWWYHHDYGTPDLSGGRSTHLRPYGLRRIRCVCHFFGLMAHPGHKIFRNRLRSVR